MPARIKKSPPPPEFSLGARVFDGAVADLAARGANGDLDFQQWLAVRRLQVIKNAEHAFAGALSQRAMQLSFVKRARVDLQTSLGGRKGAGGVDVAGALRETDDDIVGWQLRAYAGEDSAKGLNSGLFYRRIVGGNALAGVNVFADYEDGDDGDFWRWSVGGDVKNRFGEISANHYFAITDAQVVGDKTAYTREGYDVDIVARIPRLEWAKARVGYYNFKGEFGDEDETGLRGGLDLSPGKGVVFGVEYDGEDGSFGGNISYTHYFGEAQQEPQRAGDFNARAHFYDAVRREYSQRISRAEGGGGGFVIVETGVNVDVKNISAAQTTTVSLTANMVTDRAFPLGSVVIVSVAMTPAGEGVTMRGGGWSLNLSANASIEFYGGTVMNVVEGMGEFIRNGGNLTMIQMGGVTITLLGTHFDFNVISGTSVSIDLIEGALGIPASNVAVQFADTAYIVTNGVQVRCGTAMAANITGKCAISTGMESAGGTVTAGFTEMDMQVGSFTLSNAADVMATTETAGFTVKAVSGGFGLFILMANAAQPMPAPITATMIISGARQSTRRVFFTVYVNPQPLAVSYVGTPNTAPLTTGGDINIVTLQIANGYATDRRIIIDGSGGDFRLSPGGVLILGGGNTTARMTAVTIRGRDAHNTDSNSLSITVAVDATPPPPMPVCSGADSTCRTLTVTPQNASDQTQMGDVTVVSVNLRFVESGQTVQTREKVLMTLLDGAAFTVTDEQVRTMLVSPSGISVTVIDNPVTEVTVAAFFTTRVRAAGFAWIPVVNNARINIPLSLDNIQTNGNIENTVRMNIGSLPANQRNFRVVGANDLSIPNGQLASPDAGAFDHTLTLVQDANVTAGLDALRGLSLIAPLGAGGGSDSALLESEFSQPSFWQVSYLPNPNPNPNIAPPPHRRPRRNLTPT